MPELQSSRLFPCSGTLFVYDMASPQTSNGFTKIANEIMESFAYFVITPNLRSLVDVIIRQTYGYNKKEDAISLGQFSRKTGMGTRNICRYIRQGIGAKIIKKNGKKYSFNKNYDEWTLPKRAVLPKQAIGTAQTGDKLLPKQADTKEKKETIQKKGAFSPKGKKDTSPKEDMNYNEHKHSDQYDPVIDEETGEATKPDNQKKPELSKKNFSLYCDFFKKLAEDIGVSAEVGGIKDYQAFVGARKIYTAKQVEELTRFFFTLTKAKDFPTITACFSNHTRTMWNTRESNFKKMNS